MTSLEKLLDEEQKSQWELIKTVNLIILLDENSGSELIENPSSAETFNLIQRHPLKMVYNALVTVSSIL